MDIDFSKTNGWAESARRLQQTVSRAARSLRAMASATAGDGRFRTTISAVLEESFTTAILSATNDEDLYNINFCKLGLCLQNAIELYSRNVDYLYDKVVALADQCSLLYVPSVKKV